MNHDDTELFRHRLEIWLREVSGTLRSFETQRGTSATPQPDITDQATDRCENEMLLRRIAIDRHLLGDIRFALKRIEDGSFGICAQCGDEINRNRLSALPWAERCVKCQELLDHASHQVDG